MKLKSLLLGSVAAMASIPAWAADAIVAAEPEPVEYVRVCDAYGAGFFYIPGTETCLKINGYIRFQTDFGKDASGVSDYNATTRGQVQFTAKSDTEYGPLTGVMVYQANATNASSSSFALDTAYLDIAGFRAGLFTSWWDDGIEGETDTLATKAKFNSLRYQYGDSGFYAGVSVDELEDGFAKKKNDIGVAGGLGGKIDSFSYQVTAGYDTEMEEGAIRALGSVGVGPGTFSLAGVWSSGQNTYYREGKWSVAASYSVKATDKLTITPGVQYLADWSPAAYWDATNRDAVSTPNLWKAGVEVKYQIAENFYAAVSGQWQDHSVSTYVDANKKSYVRLSNDDSFSGYFRLQRAF